MHVFRLDKPFSARHKGRTIASRSATLRPPQNPRKDPHEPTDRSDVRRLLLPPSRPLRDGSGAPLSHLPSGDAGPAAAAAAPARAAGGLERGVTEAPRRRTAQVARWAQLAAIGLVGLYALLFIVLNVRDVKVSFVVVSTHVSLIWVILLSLGAGLVLGVLGSRLYRHRQRRR